MLYANYILKDTNLLKCLKQQQQQHKFWIQWHWGKGKKWHYSVLLGTKVRFLCLFWWADTNKYIEVTELGRREVYIGGKERKKGKRRGREERKAGEDWVYCFYQG